MALPVTERLPLAVIEALRCPVCGARLHLADDPTDRALRCPAGHAFDVARQGHVDLRGPRGSRGAGDDATMVARRLEVLRAGLYDPLIDALVRTVRRHVTGPGVLVDVGAGPGVHLARVLDALPDRYGLAVDVSKHAAKRAALTHERAGAVIADVWHGLPVADGAAAAVLDVFAPRDADEFHRILAPTGIAVLVTPRPDHLAGLAVPLGLLTVDPAKEERLTTALAAAFEVVGREEERWELRLDRSAAIAVAGMGPGGHHLDAAELSRRAATLPDDLAVEAVVDLTTYRPRPDQEVPR